AWTAPRCERSTSLLTSAATKIRMDPETAKFPEPTPQSFRNQQSWPRLVGRYASLIELDSDASRFLGRPVNENTDVAALPAQEASANADVLFELEKAVATRALCPPNWRRFRYTSSHWDAVDLTGDRTRWDEAMSYRTILSLVDGVGTGDGEMRDVALDECTTAMGTYPTSGLIWEAASRVSMLLGLPEQALERASHACNTMPDYAVAWVQRAVAQRALGRPYEESLVRARGLRHWEDSWRLRVESGLAEGAVLP
ncbi:MAG: hypothetical protein K1X94_24055, partial [Sandaracinaceae bacterium]|nr:hypothetical protein [Sandaracinaceae bacterium]